MQITQVEFEYVRHLVKNRVGLLLTDDKHYLVESRLHAIAAREGERSVRSLIQRLQGTLYSPLHQAVVDALMTHETLFFRDAWPFELLEKVVFPALRAARATERRVQIWSAACSTGQEAYSIAMTAASYGMHAAGIDVRILATDVSSRVLDRTREGVYSDLEMERGVSPLYRDMYFRSTSAGWAIRDDLRAMIEVKDLNLADSWLGLPSMDVVFMRNVLIYFDQATRKEIFSRLHRVMRKDGYLVLGGSEGAMDLHDTFERVSDGKMSYYRPR